MLAKSHNDIQRIYDSIQAVKSLSDRIIRIGPINIIGLDGILALLPFPAISTGYSMIAGLIILVQGLRARVTPFTWLVALVILLIDCGITTVEDITKLIPIAGPFLNLIVGGGDALFQGHLYAAHIIQADIDKTLYVAGPRNAAEHQENLAEMRGLKGKKRIVYLG
ncbi:MAG: DUF4112 domain-containing protein [Asticcacaulis sp.]